MILKWYHRIDAVGILTIARNVNSHSSGYYRITDPLVIASP